MKYGIRNTSLKMGWIEAICRAAGIGFDGIELVVASEEDLERLLKDETRMEVNSELAKHGAEVSSLSIAPFRKHHFGLGIESAVAFVERSLRACSGVEGTAILLPHFDREKIALSRPEERSFIEGLKRCAPLAEELNTRIALETSFPAEQLVRIVDEIGSSHIGVYQDFANNVIYGHDPIEMVRTLGERISMVHVKELSAEILGEGDLDWQNLAAVLGEIGYDGWLVLETSATSNPLSAARRNLRFLRSARGSP